MSYSLIRVLANQPIKSPAINTIFVSSLGRSCAAKLADKSCCRTYATAFKSSGYDRQRYPHIENMKNSFNRYEPPIARRRQAIRFWSMVAAQIAFILFMIFPMRPVVIWSFHKYGIDKNYRV